LIVNIQNLRNVMLGLLISSSLFGPAQAEGLPALVSELLANDNQIKAIRADVEAAGESIEAAKGSYYPALNITGTYGKEKQLKPTGTDNASMVSREIDFVVTQRLWDFGATDATVNMVKLQRDQTGAALQTTVSGVLLRAYTVYMNVLRASQVQRFAIESEKNVRLQTKLEDELVESGAGATTDILQAKVQLAGAMARRVQADGALELAKHAYWGVFLKKVSDVSDMLPPRLPRDKIPRTQDEAVEIALKNSPILESSNIDTLISKEAVKQSFASSYGPTFDGIVDSKLKRDVGTTAGTQTEVFAKVQFSFPFNLGMTATNTIKASELASTSSTYRYADARNQLEMRTRSAWQQLLTTQANAKLVKNQARIAAAFLELAREERKLDKRSLLDVLSGEVALINANSDAASAEADIAIAVVTLLDAMGALTVEDLR
jgi:adhesin transport system outer membrane protein